MLAKFIDDTDLSGLTNATDRERTFKIIYMGFSNKKKQTRGYNKYKGKVTELIKMQLSRSSCEKLSGTRHQQQVQEPVRWYACNTHMHTHSNTIAFKGWKGP